MSNIYIQYSGVIKSIAFRVPLVIRDGLPSAENVLRGEKLASPPRIRDVLHVLDRWHGILWHAMQYHESCDMALTCHCSKTFHGIASHGMHAIVWQAVARLWSLNGTTCGGIPRINHGRAMIVHGNAVIDCHAIVAHGNAIVTHGHAMAMP